MTVKLNACTNIKGTDGKEFTVSTSINGAALLEQALQNLGLNAAGNYRALALRKGTTLTWVDPKKNIVHYHLKEGSNIYILKIMQPLSVETTSGIRKKLLIDITKPTKDVIKFISEKLRIDHYEGYALYTTEEDKNLHPLGMDLTLPQQSTNYESLVFKRRFYFFIKSHFTDKFYCQLILNEVIAHVSASKIPCTHDQAVMLAIYTIYAQAQNPEDVTPQSVPADVAQYFPQQCPPVDGDRQKIIDFITQLPAPLTKEEATLNYMTVAHQIPYFGCEILRTKFAKVEEEDSKAARQDGTLICGPKCVTLLLPTNEQVISVPWFRFIGCKEHKSSVDFRYMDRKGQEAELSFKVKKPNELATFLEGCQSVSRTLGAQLMTEGFFSQDDNNSNQKIDPEIFKQFYTPDESMLYTYFPGSTEELKKVLETIDDIISYQPDYGNELKKLSEELEQNPGDIKLRLKIIKILNSLLKLENHTDFLDENVVERAMATISSINIIPPKIEELISEINTLIEHQKIIRSEIMTHIESSKKAQLTQWVKTLKEHRQRLTDFNKILQDKPTIGTTMLQVKKQLLQLISDIKGLTFFVSQIISMSPDSSYLIAIENFNIVLKSVTTPLIPTCSSESNLNHVFALHNIIFYAGISIAIISKSLDNDLISKNTELLEKVGAASQDVFKALYKVYTSLESLNKRPFHLDILDELSVELEKLKRAFVQLKPQGDMISEITGDETVSNSISYVNTLIDENMNLFSNTRIHPFRRVPTVEKVNEIIQLIAEINQTLDVAMTSTTAQPSFIEHIQEKKNALMQIAFQLDLGDKKPQRSIIDVVNLIPNQLKDLLSNLNDLTNAIGNASIIHQITKLQEETDKIITRRVPTFDEFHQLLKQLNEATKEVKDNTVIELTSLLSLAINTSDMDDVQQYVEGMREWTSKVSDSTTPGIRELICMVLQISDAVKQLPTAEFVTPPPLLIFPFFQGKDVYKMTSEFTQQITDINRFITDFLKFNIFSNNELFSGVIRHWSNYFDGLNGQIDGLQSHESTLISRLKEINRKAPQMKLFIRNIIPYTNDHKFKDMINVFFQNCELIITKLSQPHISKSQAARFSEIITPALSQGEIQLSRFIQNCPPGSEEILEKVKALRQSISQRISDASGQDSTKQQDLADKLYGQLTEILPELRGNSECAQIAQQLNSLRAQLSEFTALSLNNNRGMSSSAFLINTVPETEVKEIFNSFYEGKECQTLLTTSFKKLTSEPEMLPLPAAFAAKVLKNTQASTIPDEAIRLLVYTQGSNENKKEQFRNMSINDSIHAAVQVKALGEAVNSLDTSGSEKATYYKELITTTLNSFDPEILSNHPSFPSVALTYSSLREVMSLITLLLNEKPDEELQKKADQYTKIINQSDISLKLYFFNNFEMLSNELHELSLINEKAASIYAKIQDQQETITDKSILLEQNSVTLAKVAQCYEEVKDDIVALVAEIGNTNETAQKISEEVNAIKDIKYIVKNWADPMTEFNQDEFRRSVLADLALTQKEQPKLDFALRTNIMTMPLASSSLLTHLSSAVALAKKHADKVDGVKDIVEQLEKDISEINRCNVQLFSDEEAYKADISLQRIVPEMEQRVQLLIAAVSKIQEPEYSNVASVKVSAPRQIDIVSSTMEGTEYFQPTKDVCSFVKECFDNANASEESEVDQKALTHLVELIPAYSTMSIEEGKAELNSATETFLENAESRKEVIPKLIASLVRVIPTISNETIEDFGIEPVEILKESEKNTPQVESKLFLLNSYIKFMDQDKEYLKNESTQSTVRIIEALDTEDASEINRIMQTIFALRRAVADKGEQSTLLSGIIENFNSIKEGIQNSLSNSQKLDEKTASEVFEIKRELIKSLTGESMALTETIQKCKTIEDILDVRTNNNLSARTLVGQIDTNENKARKHLIFVAANMHILAYKGLTLTATAPRSFFRDYISLFDSSLSTLNHILTSEGADSKKYLRMFRRVVDNMGDVTDDLSLELNSEPLSQFEEYIKQFLVASAGIESSIANINAAYATAEIPQSFTLVLSEQKSIIKENVEDLIKKGEVLSQQNTIEGLSANLTAVINTLKEAIENFLAVDQHVEINNFIELELKISSAFESSAAIAIQMTDAVQLKYDPESASKLPNKFKMPQLPSLLEDKKISDYRDSLIQLRGNLDAEVVALRKLASGLTCDHAELLSHTLAFIQEANQFIISIFYVSISSTNLQKQSDLTSVATSLVSAVDAVNKSSRSLFLSIPTWNNDANAALDHVNEQADAAVSIANEAVEIFQKEEDSKDARATLFIEATRPLQNASSKAKEALEALATKDATAMFKTIAANLITITITGAHIVQTTLLHAKDSEKSAVDPEKMTAAAGKVADKVIEVANVQSPEDVIKQSEEFSKVMENFDATINPDAKDAENMRTTVKQISTSAIALKETVEKTLASAKVAGKSPEKKKIKVAAPQKSPEEKAKAQEKLMKRLTLESRVHCSRWWLEHSEKILATYD